MDKYIKSVLKSNVASAILNVLITIEAVIILISIGYKSLLDNIQFGIFSEILLTYNAFVEDYPYISEFVSSKSGFNTLMVALAVTFSIKVISLYIKDKLVIIKHTSFSNTLSPYNKENFKNYKVTEKKIDLSTYIDRNQIKEAIKIQDNKIKEIKDSSKNTELIYYGISHTPLIFRAGFQIGDERNVRLLHKKRNGTSVFEEIEQSEDYRLEYKKFANYLNRASKELLIVIATSLKITGESLHIFDKNNLNAIIVIGLEKDHMYSFDNMTSYAVLERTRKYILQHIRQHIQNNNIEKVHMVLSTSSAFTFYLAQGFSNNHDPEIITYHYDASSAEKYVWGISNKADAENALTYLKQSQNI